MLILDLNSSDKDFVSAYELVKRVEDRIAVAVAEEFVKDYKSARQYYLAAIASLTQIAENQNGGPASLTLADIVRENIKTAQGGLMVSEAMIKLSAYVAAGAK